MSKFTIVWTSGLTEIVEQNEANTVEEFVAIQFGSAWDAAVEAGVTVTAADQVQEAVAETPVETPTENTQEPVPAE